MIAVTDWVARGMGFVALAIGLVNIAREYRAWRKEQPEKNWPEV